MFYENVHVLALDYVAFVNDIYLDLAIEINLANVQFVAQGLFLDGLQESRAKQSIDFNSRANSPSR
ncbi:MAG: hypothetical protein QGG73_02340 [Candidatus Hydrogenedentes bacterium]|nr:hypothetical protein [Candidatus Hydrogenedentota bacterium]